jgi:uncharacterized membrane protein YqjE
VSSASPDGSRSGQRGGGAHNIATAITEVSERFTVLVHEEIELAKAEVNEKVAKLARGAVVALAAGVFLVTALFFVLIGLALLLYYVLPVNAFAYFWGFFAMALILIVLGALAGLIAARAVKRSSPPVPQMAIDEARKIRESLGSGADGAHAAGAPADPAPAAYPGGGAQSTAGVSGQ